MDQVALPKISLEKIDRKSLGGGIVKIGSGTHAESNPDSPTNPRNWTYYYDFKNFSADTNNEHPSSFTPLLKNYGKGGVSEKQCLTYYGNYEQHSDHVAVNPTGRVIAFTTIHVNGKFALCLKTKFADIEKVELHTLILGYNTPRAFGWSCGIYQFNRRFGRWINGSYGWMSESGGNASMIPYQNKMLYVFLMYEENQYQAYIFSEDNLTEPAITDRLQIFPGFLSELSKEEAAKVGLWTGDGKNGSADIYKFAWTNEFGNLSIEQMQEVVRELAKS